MNEEMHATTNITNNVTFYIGDLLYNLIRKEYCFNKMIRDLMFLKKITYNNRLKTNFLKISIGQYFEKGAFVVKHHGF